MEPLHQRFEQGRFREVFDQSQAYSNAQILLIQGNAVLNLLERLLKILTPADRPVR